jgi:hypothetical protein
MAGSGRVGEYLVQKAAELLREGRESGVVAGELDDGRAELAGECHGRAVGELSLRCGPRGDHDAGRRRPQCRDVGPVTGCGWGAGGSPGHEGPRRAVELSKENESTRSGYEQVMAASMA